MKFGWWRGNSQIDGIGRSPKKSDAFFSKLGESSGLNGTFYWNMGSWHCMCGLLILLIQLEYWYFQLPCEVKGTHKLWRKRLLHKEFYGRKNFLPPQGLVALPQDFGTKTTLSMSIVLQALTCTRMKCSLSRQQHSIVDMDLSFGVEYESTTFV